MRYFVRRQGVPLGAVELPAGTLVAGRLEPLPAYAAIDRIVRRATEAFLQLGVFGAAALDDSALASDGRLDRWAMRRAAGLELELVDTGGETLDTTFVNLLAGSMDAGVVVVCCFVRTNTRNEAATEPAEPMLG